jgi:hypothetical protein
MKTTTMKIMTLAAIVLLAASASHAAGVGTAGADFLNIGVGARQLAMGSAAAAVDTDLDANVVNWNPGALGFIEHANVTASYNSLFQDENQGFVAYASPLGQNGGVWAAHINYLMVSNIEARTTDTENPDSKFTDQNYALAGSYGHKLGDNLSVGGTVKYVREYLPGLSANAMAIDGGALYRTPIAGLTAGASFKNLGNNIGPDPMPLTMDGGLAYKLLGDKLVLASDFDWLAIEKTTYASLGAEWWLNKALALRGGYQFGHGADQLQSSMVGMGVGLGLRVQGFALDYAFLPYGDLGNTHRITIGFRF